MENKILHRFFRVCLTLVLALIFTMTALAKPVFSTYDIRLTLDYCTDSESYHPEDDYLANVFLLQDTSTGCYVQAALDAGIYRVTGETSAEAEATCFCFGQDATDPAVLVISNLHQGSSYTLLQLEATDGYQCLRDGVKIVISEGAATVDDKDAPLEERTDGSKTLNVRVVLSKVFVLTDVTDPRPHWLLPVCIALTVISCMVVMLTLSAKRLDKSQKSKKNDSQ